MKVWFAYDVDKYVEQIRHADDEKVYCTISNENVESSENSERDGKKEKSSRRAKNARCDAGLLQELSWAIQSEQEHHGIRNQWGDPYWS